MHKQDEDHDGEWPPITPEQRTAARRELHTLLRFWTACPTRRCRRYRRCAGDPSRCRAIFWPVLPADVRHYIGALIKARNAGRSKRAAEQIAEVAAARARQLVALGDKV
jgi:hypothetical protein